MSLILSEDAVESYELRSRRACCCHDIEIILMTASRKTSLHAATFEPRAENIIA